MIQTLIYKNVITNILYMSVYKRYIIFFLQWMYTCAFYNVVIIILYCDICEFVSSVNYNVLCEIFCMNKRTYANELNNFLISPSVYTSAKSLHLIIQKWTQSIFFLILIIKIDFVHKHVKKGINLQVKKANMEHGMVYS